MMTLPEITSFIDGLEEWADDDEGQLTRDTGIVLLSIAASTAGFNGEKIAKFAHIPRGRVYAIMRRLKENKIIQGRLLSVEWADWGKPDLSEDENLLCIISFIIGCMVGAGTVVTDRYQPMPKKLKDSAPDEEPEPEEELPEQDAIRKDYYPNALL